MTNQDDGGSGAMFSSHGQLDQTDITLLTSEPQPTIRQHHSRFRQMGSRLSWYGNLLNPAVSSPLPPLPDDRQHLARETHAHTASLRLVQEENNPAARLVASYSSSSAAGKPKLTLDTNFSTKNSQLPASRTVNSHQADVVDDRTSFPVKSGVFGFRRLLRRSRPTTMPWFSRKSTIEEKYLVIDGYIEQSEAAQMPQPDQAHRHGTVQNRQPLVGTWETSMAMHPPHPPPSLRKKPSMRDRLRVLHPKPSDQVLNSQSIEQTTRKSAPYVPKHAASDFSRIRVKPQNHESTSLRGSLSSKSTRDADARQSLLADAPRKLSSIADHPSVDEPALVSSHRNTAPLHYQPTTTKTCPSEQQTRPSTPDLQIRSGDSPSSASTEYSLCPYDSGLVSPLSATSHRTSKRLSTLDDALLFSPLTPRPKHTIKCGSEASKKQHNEPTESSRKQTCAIMSTSVTSPEQPSTDYQLFLAHAAQRHQRQHEQLWHKLSTPDGQVVYTTNTALNEDEPRWKRSAMAQPATQVHYPHRHGRGSKAGSSLGGSGKCVSEQKEKLVEERKRGGRGLGRRISQYLRPTRESNVWDEKVLRLGGSEGV